MKLDHAVMAILSAALLAAEISLTRVFAYLIWYHAVFRILSMALLGRFYECRGRHPEGEEMCRKAIEINPGNDLAYAELGMIYEADSWEKAEPMSERLLN